MDHIEAIGFDLFNTLITLEPPALDSAIDRLIHSLEGTGFSLKDKPFLDAYDHAVLLHIEESRKTGKETHNRYWISDALHTLGYRTSPDDPDIAKGVDAYFSAFFHGCRLIPNTKDMLEILKKKYRLGLLTNFTHPPAVLKIIETLGLNAYFDVVLVSGEMGFRKPHPLVFRSLTDLLKVKKHQLIYVGDDPEPDIIGAWKAGLRPVWTTCVRDQKISVARGLFSKGDDTPDFQVPRISKWEDIFSLLDGGLRAG
jgi:putative hydrolase of the HAD superfamily